MKKRRRFTVSDGELVLTLEPAKRGGYVVTSRADPDLLTRSETMEQAFTLAREAAKGLRSARTNSPTGDVLDRLLAPLGLGMTRAMARKIAEFRADAATQARIDELADKCTEGELTAAERREYEAYVRAIDLIAILQSQARLVLARNGKSR